LQRYLAKALLDLYRGGPETHHGNRKRLSEIAIQAGVDVSPRHARPIPLIDHGWFALPSIKIQPLRAITLGLRSIWKVRIHADGFAASRRSMTRSMAMRTTAVMREGRSK
jgi:hypothetical protein